MAIRHKVVKATLDRGYASEWNDDHHFDPEDEIDYYVTFIEQALTDDWDTAQTTGATVPTVSLVNDHAFMTLDSTVDVGDIASIRKELAGAVGNITDPDDLPVMTMTIRLVSPAGAGTTHEFGLFASATTPFTANQNGAYFRVVANVLYAVNGNGANESTTALGSPNEYGVYRIEFTSTSIKFYVDDLENPVATHNTYITTSNLTMKLSTIGVAAGAQILRSDFVGLTRLRKH